MSKTYRPYNPDQLLLLPPSLKDWLPKDHLVYFIDEVFDELDLSAIEEVYEREERGYPPYNPRMMAKILFYAQSVGVRSSRKIDAREDRKFGPDRRGDELPPELADREKRLAKIRQAKAALEAEARQRGGRTSCRERFN